MLTKDGGDIVILCPSVDGRRVVFVPYSGRNGYFDDDVPIVIAHLLSRE